MNWKTEILNHLWQSTAFAAAIALATLFLRRNSPRLRYWLWLAASIKFLIPFSLLVATGAKVQLPPDTPSLHAVTVQQVSLVFSPITLPATQSFNWIPLLTTLWIAGAVFLTARWLSHWCRIHQEAIQSTKLALDYPVPVHTSNRTLEPGVFGLINPVLLLPEGLTRNLTEEQFEAVLTHESRHVECYDNLTAALHMAVETIFWFHPLVWWIGARLIAERERDCDEAVLRCGSQPGAYARSIVHVCQTYGESPLPCASGISGSDLKERIREIMVWRGSLPMTRTGKAILAIAALAAVALPFALGILRAQTLPPDPTLTYDVVSIHKSAPGSNNHLIGPGPQGGWRIVNSPVGAMLAIAYGVQDYQIIGAPGWASSQSYDIIFTPDKSEPSLGEKPSLQTIQASMNRNAQRLRAVLHDRFGLVLKSETRELPIYRLVQAKGGHKLSPHDPSKPGPSISSNERKLTAVDVTVALFVQSLARHMDRPIEDQTHIEGEFDFEMTWTSDSGPAQPDAPLGASIFTALTEQLGLKLESAKGPVQVYVVEKLEPPTEN